MTQTNKAVIALVIVIYAYFFMSAEDEDLCNEWHTWLIEGDAGIPEHARLGKKTTKEEYEGMCL